MRSAKLQLRAVVSAFVALVFAIAATPGSMAMPQAQSSPAHSVMAMPCGSAEMTGHPCDHMKPVKEQGTPCKSIGQCLGMLACYGMGAVAWTIPVLPVPERDVLVAFAHQRGTGLVPQPDNPPPIL